jgi:ubiquinone/menaquinone biosynthesis C-methylase UbiE
MRVFLVQEGVIELSYTVGTKNQKTREAWLENTLKKIPAGSRILDAGAGEQKYKKFCTHLNYVSQDFAQYDGKGDGIALQTKKWDTSNLDIVSDITSIPESDASFDAIMCIEVFEHIPEPILAIKEFSRLLKPGGHLILTAPFCSLTHMAPYHFYSGYNRYFYKKHLVDNGFKIIDLTENGNFFEFLAQELRRLPNVEKDYTGSVVKFGLFDRIAQRWLLRTLERASRNDHGSKDLLNFGFHVYAIKPR